MEKVKTIVILHGWGLSAESFAPLAGALRVRGFSVYVLDLPGFGDAPAPDAAWNVAAYAEWLRAWMDREGVAHCAFLGHSFGGRIALHLAATTPERVRALILVASAGIPPRLSARQGVFKVGKWASNVFPVLKTWARRRFAHLDYYKTDGVMRKVFLNVIKDDVRPLLARVQCPTLILWGTDDFITPLRDGKVMARMIPNATLIVTPGGDHALYRKHTTAVADATTEFLSSIQ